VTKLSFGAAAFKDVNEITVEKMSVSVSSVRQPCLICMAFKDMNKYTLVRNPTNARNEENSSCALIPFRNMASLGWGEFLNTDVGRLHYHMNFV
jgi:hypothetical protein